MRGGVDEVGVGGEEGDRLDGGHDVRLLLWIMAGGARDLTGERNFLRWNAAVWRGWAMECNHGEHGEHGGWRCDEGEELRVNDDTARRAW